MTDNEKHLREVLSLIELAEEDDHLWLRINGSHIVGLPKGTDADILRLWNKRRLRALGAAS